MRDDTPFKSHIKLLKKEETYRFLHYNEDIWPWQIEISPTDECNLKCPWCVSGELTHAAREKRNTLDSKVLMDFLSDFREHNGKAVTFTGGGEPTQHPDIYEILFMTHRLGLQIGFFTNGVYPYQLNEVLKYCQWIRFSVDFGPSGIHKKNHTPEMFDQMMANIERLRLEPCRLGLNANLGKYHTQQDVNELLDLADKADYLQFRVLLPTKFTEDFELAHIWQHVFYLRDTNQLTPNVLFSEDRLRELRNRRFYNWKVCEGHHFVPFLHADGNLQTCAYHPNNPKTHFGNIYKESYEQIWKGDRRKEAIEYVANLDYKSMCQPCCKLTAVNETLDALRSDVRDENFV